LNAQQENSGIQSIDGILKSEQSVISRIQDSGPRHFRGQGFILAVSFRDAKHQNGNAAEPARFAEATVIRITARARDAPRSSRVFLSSRRGRIRIARTCGIKGSFRRGIPSALSRSPQQRETLRGALRRNEWANSRGNKESVRALNTIEDHQHCRRGHLKYPFTLSASLLPIPRRGTREARDLFLFCRLPYLCAL